MSKLIKVSDRQTAFTEWYGYGQNWSELNKLINQWG